MTTFETIREAFRNATPAQLAGDMLGLGCIVAAAAVALMIVGAWV